MSEAKQLPLIARHNNRSLFSDYFLDEVLPRRAEWRDLISEAKPVQEKLLRLYERFRPLQKTANEAQTEHEWIQPVLETLGHTFTVQPSLKVPGGMQQPDYVFYASEADRLASQGRPLDDHAAERGAIAIGDAKHWDRPLDQMVRSSSQSFSNKNPSWQIFFYLLHSGLSWGLLTNGRKWRLYHRSTAHKLDVFYEVDLPELIEGGSVEQFLYFYAFFRPQAFNAFDPLSLDRLLTASGESVQRVRENLREQVYDALRLIAQGLFQYPRNELAPTPENRRLVYENALILLYRLLFIFYAEARQLLPVESGTVYSKRFSLRLLAQQAARLLQEKTALPNVALVWMHLKTLFESLHAGNSLMGVSVFDGGLFDPQKAEFLERYKVGDKALCEALELLAYAPDPTDRNRKAPIDYRDLSERHLGTIYEGLLEYTLYVAEEPMAELQATSEVVPLSAVNGRPIARRYEPGEVYLVTDSGQRKLTGSYYTPDFVVKYMVERTLGPVLEERLAQAQSPEERVAAVLRLNVLDPAMGSGHFLVEALEFLARYLVELGALPEAGTGETDVVYWKRRVAQQCLYGVDLNPLAVELAKLSLWLATAARGYPLSFLDHHLRPGNALVGSWLAEAAGGRYPLAGQAARTRTGLGTKGNGRAGRPQSPAPQPAQVAQAGAEAPGSEAVPRQLVLLEEAAFRSDLETALQWVSEIEETEGRSLEEVQHQEAIYERLRGHFIARYQGVLNLATALFYGLESGEDLWPSLAAYVLGKPGAYPLETQFARLRDEANTTARGRQFFHWELEFPEVFFAPDGRHLGAEAGFDVVIGNPPYVRQEKLAEDKPFLQEHYPVYHGQADLFVYFFGQGLRLLRPGGRLAYISSNSWLRANYATALRQFLRTQTTVEEIVDLGNTRIFADAPDLSPAILVVRKAPPTPGQQAQVAVFSRGEGIRDFTERLEKLRFAVTIQDQPDSGWQLRGDASRRLFARLLASGRPLKEVVAGHIYYGIKTGLNEAFIVDTATRERLIKSDPASSALLKPLVRGEDLRPWYQENEGRWLICIPSGWTQSTFPGASQGEAAAWQQFAERYPHLAAHLEPFASAARKRYDKGQFWWELRPCDYYQAFEETKIFWPDMAKYPRFSWDEHSYFCNDKGFILKAADISLLAILQARVIWFCISNLCAPLAEREGLMIYQQKIQYIERLPIPELSEEQRQQLGALARQLTEVARQRYELRQRTTHRIITDLGAGQARLSERLSEWWTLSFDAFREELRRSFKRDIPLRERDAWENLLSESRQKIEQLTAEIVRLETDLNNAVYDLFDLNKAERSLIETETRYRYGEW
ncbi:Eco57I restriction-modification methylase domain-containing protein [Thermogemmatispora sp.]|uniref:Eco57I restriction-modification methylase domain-containing protein n=1 Tax=Thermogemmatispora sp. TaxID=1968838 RepID=UPI0035E3F899